MDEHIQDEKYVCNKCGFESKVGGYCILDDGGYMAKRCECDSGDYAFECCEPEHPDADKIAQIQAELDEEIEKEVEESKQQEEEEEEIAEEQLTIDS